MITHYPINQMWNSIIPIQLQKNGVRICVECGSFKLLLNKNKVKCVECGNCKRLVKVSKPFNY